MHEIPSLKYKYGDLEPYIDEETMRLHHTKHHQGYVDKLNVALEAYPDLAKEPVENLLRDLERVPEAIRSVVQNHGGGHYNHTLWWQMIGPASASAPARQGPREQTLTGLDQSFGGLVNFKTQFKEAALARFGSGWVWLAARPGESHLRIISIANQDSPLGEGQTPLLGVDVWEHAYYLKYQNRRADYLEAFWQVVNWEFVESQLARFVASK